ncbi:MAG: N-acetylglucosamine kinase [Devosia sp.]
MTRGFLGIDVGGTASRFVVVGEDGGELARGSVAGATGHLFAASERERFAKMIAEVAEAVPTPIAGVHAGITGLGPKAYSDARALIAARFRTATDAVTARDDMELAFLAAFRPGQGHLIAAGTGSVGLHITAEGEAIRVGGRGMLIDDGGSGTWIALTALNELYRRIDATGGPAGATCLAAALYAQIGGTEWDDVRAFVYGADRGRIGSLAQAVAAAAAQGDQLAQEILRRAAVELARLASALINRTRSLPVAFVGGVIELHPLIRSVLVEALPSAELIFPIVDAARHAALMARNRFGGT